MSTEVEFVRRTLAALEARGRPLPPDIARRLERGFRAVLTDPNIRLDDALGIRPRPGKRSISFDATKRERDLADAADKSVIADIVQRESLKERLPQSRNYFYTIDAVADTNSPGNTLDD